jgi:Tol biopolymer transport system component
VSNPDDLILGDVAPRFSPDGRQISFIRIPHRLSQQLRVVPAHGGAEVAIGDSQREITDQAWSRDSATLFYASNRGGEFRIWKTPASGGRAGGAQATAVYGEFAIQFALPPTQGSLIYTVLRNDPNIWRYDLRQPEGTHSNWTRLIASAGLDASPQYSPDGSRVCFRSDRSGKEQLWLANADGSGAVPITALDAAPSVPRWFPDGHALVVNTRDCLIALVREHDGKWETETLKVMGVHPVVSPDGKWLYAGTDDAILRFSTAGVAAGERVVSARGISLGIAPDGSALYFVREPAATSLWRYRFSDGSLTRILDGLLPYCGSCWAAANDGIYYLSAQGESRNQQAIFFLDFATSRTRLVVAYPEPTPPLGIGPFSLSPDGRYLLTVRVDPSVADLLRVEHFH